MTTAGTVELETALEDVGDSDTDIVLLALATVSYFPDLHLFSLT